MLEVAGGEEGMTGCNEKEVYEGVVKEVVVQITPLRFA